MKSSHIFISLAVAVAVMDVTVHAANITKADNSTTLDLGGSWTGGVAPSPTDVATWDSTIVTLANCTNTLGATTNWGGVEILNPPAPVQINGTPTLYLGSSGIDLNETGTSQSIFFNLPVNVVSNQTWAAKAGQTITFSSKNIIVTNVTVTTSGTVNCNSGFSVNGGGMLIVSSGAFTLVTNFLSANPFSVGADANGGTVIQNGGTVSVSAGGGTSGSYVASLPIGASSNPNAASTYSLNAGILQDITSNHFAYCSPGNSLNATGTLNISGGSASFYSLRMGNGSGHGYVNVTNGTLTVTTGEFSIGRGTSTGGNDGTMSIYGGTVSAPGISVNLPKGNGAGVLNMYGGAFNIGSSLGIPAGSTANGTVNLNGGILTITNNLNLPGGGTGSGTVNLNGGVLAVSAISVTPGGSGALELNGGILKARASSGNFITNSSMLAVHVDSGGAIIDTSNSTVTIPAVLLNGTGGSADGGLTKLGVGKLTLAAQNTYNGPTIVGAGTLALSTNYNIGALVVSNAATFDVVLSSAGTTLNASSFTEGASPGNSLTNEFDLGAFGNPTTPVVNATNLTANGNVSVIVNGTGLSIGAIQLIKYSGSIAGSGTFTLNFLEGAAGYVTNNTSTHSINLVITGFPDLTWKATINNNWDLATGNWVDTNNVAANYVDGATVNFNDTAANTSVVLTNAFSPAAVNLSNVNSNYIFSGSGSIGGAGALTKTGAGMVTMALTNNSYTGNTIISNGTYQLGVANAIPGGSGRGNVTLEGTLNLAGFNQSVNGLNGNNGTVDNSSATPVTFSVGNNSGTGIFAGEITNSGAALALNIAGGSLTLLGTNGYSGGTTNAGGILVLASPQSIGPGQLALNAGTLAWTGSAANILTNSVSIGGSVTLGATGNGLSTLSNTVNLNGGGRGLTCNSDVLMPNGATNGSITVKSGTGTLTLRNTTADWTGGALQVSQGNLVLDGDTISLDGNNLRVQCNITNGVSDLVITNGATFVITNSSGNNLRVGANDTSGAPGCTNILDVAGIVDLIAYPGTSDKLLMGGASSTRDAADIVNLYAGGILMTRQVTNTAIAPTITTFNFDGGTLMATTNADASDFFDVNIISLNVLDGGAVIDTAGFNGITINNDLTAGGTGIGSFTKNGTGQLILAGSGGFGTSSYGGATIVNGGTLTLLVPVPNTTNYTVAAGAVLDVTYYGATLTSGESIAGGGGVLGSITVGSGALVLPGTPTTTGTLTFSNIAPALGGTTILKLSRNNSPNSDQIALASGTLNYGGALVVTNIGVTPHSGDKFYLFSAQSYSGSFANVTLPLLPAGLGFTNNFLVDGSLTVTGAVATPSIPIFKSVVFKNGNLILSGTNGTASTDYRILTTTNLTIPLTNWTVVATDNFDGSGNFIFTNTATNTMQFFNIVSP